jgi:hypothetical protein
MTADPSPREVARALARRVDQLAVDLLPGGHREGHEWRAGSTAGEAGDSLGVHLAGAKAGVWSDFATGECGDALDLVRAVLELDMGGAIRWSLRWLGIEDGDAELPARSSTQKASIKPLHNSDFWRAPWRSAQPIAGALAELYLAGRGLRFDDPGGRVLRFAERHARRNPADELEHYPALLALLRDVRIGEPCGTINVYLRRDGGDRLRDPKGKTSWGRAGGSAVMLDDFADVTLGLVVAEGVETAIALWMAELRPVWALGGAGNLKSFPVLGGIEALTIAADADDAGQKAAAEVIRRWRGAGREVLTVAPPAGDWADQAVKRQAAR